jgi:predicted  nucleic acid-binding Zn-ribbon protein
MKQGKVFQKLQKKLETLRDKKRFEEDELAKFNNSIRRGSKAEMPYEKLKKLNTLYKMNYIDKVIEETEYVKQLLEQSNSALETGQKEIGDLVRGIEDCADTWREGVDGINKVLLERAHNRGFSDKVTRF